MEKVNFMFVESIKIYSYKSFYTTPVLEFTAGFNVIIGPNNAGKTTLIEALSLRFEDKPHRSLAASGTVSSAVEVNFRFREGEILELLTKNSPDFYIPTTGQQDDHFLTNIQTAIQESNLLRCTYQNGKFNSAYLEPLKSIPNPDSFAIIKYNASTNQFVHEGMMGFPNKVISYGNTFANFGRWDTCSPIVCVGLTNV